MRVVLAAALGGVMLAGCAQPEPAGVAYPVQFQCPRSGTSVTSSTGATLRYGGAQAGDREVCLLYMANGIVPMLYNWRRASPPGADEFRRAMRRFFPLSPGKTAEFASLGQDGQAWQTTLTAVGLETVIVPAGQFQAWKVIEDERGFGSNIHHSRKRYWIDSESWIPVKGEFELISGSWGPRPLRNWEAVKVIRP